MWGFIPRAARNVGLNGRGFRGAFSCVVLNAASGTNASRCVMIRGTILAARAARQLCRATCHATRVYLAPCLVPPLRRRYAPHSIYTVRAPRRALRPASTAPMPRAAAPIRSALAAKISPPGVQITIAPLAECAIYNSLISTGAEAPLKGT